MMKRIFFLVFTIFLLTERSSWGEVSQFTTDDLRRLAATEGMPEACENNDRWEKHIAAPVEVVLHKLNRDGTQEPVRGGHVILPRGTHVEKDRHGYYTCQGKFIILMKSPISFQETKKPRSKEIPKAVEPIPMMAPLPEHLVVTVEVKHSGEFTVNHKIDPSPSLLALLRNTKDIEEKDGASAWRGFSHKQERCFDSGTAITALGTASAGYFVGARNPDSTNAEIRNNNRGLLISACIAAIGALFLPGSPGCKAGVAALAFGGGYLFGNTVKPPDEVREKTPSPTPVQPQPGLGGIPPPDPNAPPFPPADPPN